MPRREVALSVLAYLDIPAPEFVDIAAASGFDSVSLRVAGGRGATPSELSDRSRVAATARRLAATGLGVIDAEVLRLGPDLETAEIDRTIDVAASLGARHLLTVNTGWDDRWALVEQLSRVQAGAEPAGVRPCLEFMAFTGCRSLDSAVDVALASGTAVLVDSLHLFRSGGDTAQLRAAVERHGSELFPYAQLCDAPVASPPRAELRDEAVGHRLLPGDGELPLTEILGALPALSPVAIEAPTTELGALPPRARAERTMQATRKTLTTRVRDHRRADSMADGIPRVAVVTGAGSGLGKAFAELWLRRHGPVVGLDLDADRVSWLAGQDRAGLVGDVTSQDDNDAAVALAEERFGRVDAMVLSAGVSAWGGIEDLDLAVFDRVMDINVRAAALGIRAAAPAMRRAGGGSIVGLSSSSGTAGEADHWAYCTSKAALSNLMRSAAMDLAGDGIRVNVVAPGPTHTELTGAIRRDEPEKYETLRSAVPLQRWGEGEELAEAIAFMAGPESSFVTAAVLPVDGGVTGRTAQLPPPAF